MKKKRIRNRAQPAEKVNYRTTSFAPPSVDSHQNTVVIFITTVVVVLFLARMAWAAPYAAVAIGKAKMSAANSVSSFTNTSLSHALFASIEGGSDYDVYTYAVRVDFVQHTVRATTVTAHLNQIPIWFIIGYPIGAELRFRPMLGFGYFYENQVGYSGLHLGNGTYSKQGFGSLAAAEVGYVWAGYRFLVEYGYRKVYATSLRQSAIGTNLEFDTSGPYFRLGVSLDF